MILKDIKKHWGKSAASMLDVIVLAASLFFILSACAAAESDGGDTVSTGAEPAFRRGSVYSYSSAWEQMLSYDAGNSYAIDDSGKVTISYNHGETTATAYFNIHTDADNIARYPGAFISEDKTAFSYGDFDGTTPLVIYISDDMGKTWQTSELSLPNIGVSRSYIGFSSKDNGWLVVCNWHAMTYEDNYIYRTSDGGKTWTAADGNQNDVYPSVVTGAGFSEGNTAFLCFWYYEKDFQPPVIWSQDGGKTWEKLFLELPEDYDKYSKTALSPSFDGASGTLPALLSEGGVSAYAGIVYFRSTDDGKIWHFDDKSGMVLVPPVVTASMSPGTPVRYPEYALDYYGTTLHLGVQDGLYPWGLTFNVNDEMFHTSGDMPGVEFRRFDGDGFRLFFHHIEETGKDILSTFMTTSDAYETARGIVRGDSVEKLLEVYSDGLLYQPKPFPVSQDLGGDLCVYDELYVYTREEDDNCCIVFYVVNRPDSKFITGIQISLGQDGGPQYFVDNVNTYHVDYTNPDQYLKTDTRAEDKIHALFRAKEPVRITALLEALTDINWRIYGQKYPDEQYALYEWLYQQKITAEYDILCVLKATKGLDGALSEGYSGILANIYRDDNMKFISLVSRLDDSKIDEIARLICYDLSLDKAQVIAELEEYQSSGKLTAKELLVVVGILHYFDLWY